MANQLRTLGDPAYAAQVSRVLELWYQGQTGPQIATALDVTEELVEKTIRTYGDPLRPKQTAVDWLLQTRQIVIMAAGNFSPAQIARTFGVTLHTAQHRIASLAPEIDQAKRLWRDQSIDAGFAIREYRIWQINDDLLWLEQPIPEQIWFERTVASGRDRETTRGWQPTSQMIPRKFEKDQFGRPVWALYRSKLLDEMAKLKGDHSSTLHLGFNAQTQRLLQGLTQPRLPEPAVDVEHKVLGPGPDSAA